MLMVWHKLKKVLSLKRKDNNSQNETDHSKSPAIPSSPSSLSRLPSPKRSSKGTCVICLRSMKAEKGKAIFTAECRHSFHFSCIGKNVKHGNHICPICRCKWKEIPFQFGTDVNLPVHGIRLLHSINRSRPLPTTSPPPPQHVQFSDGGSSNVDVIDYNVGSDVQHSGRG